MFKNLITSILYFFAFIFISTIIITIFNYFNILNFKIISMLKFIFPVIGIVVSGFILGKNSAKNGYIEGIKLGAIVVSIFLLLTVINKSFEVKSIIYYLVLLLSSILSSMIGINKKKAT